jgi:hypothetical protein
MAEKITYIKRETSDREGNALKTRDNRPYTRVLLKVESKADRYISGFGSDFNAKWEVGDAVDITITESDKKDKNGVAYLNFTMPKKEDKVDEKLELILNKLVGLQLEIRTLADKITPSKSSYPVNDSPEPFSDESLGEVEEPF